MTARTAAAFFEAGVGRYRLALRTSRVRHVVGETRTVVPLELDGARFPCVDLRVLSGAAARTSCPFVLALESGSGRLGVGVDSVQHVAAAAANLARVPAFGLQAPHLFEGALRLPHALVLVVDAEQLILFLAARGDIVFA